jgi:hypothetical protein
MMNFSRRKDAATMAALIHAGVGGRHVDLIRRDYRPRGW